MRSTYATTYGSAYATSSRRNNPYASHGPHKPTYQPHTRYGSTDSGPPGMTQTSYQAMKPHINNRNIRRVEPESILRDYRNGYQNCYQNNTPSAVFPTATRATEGEEALKRVKERVQESLRKRGCLVGGQKVKMCVKPTIPDPHVLKINEKPSIDKILPGGEGSTGLARKQVEPQGLRLASSAAKPPSMRATNVPMEMDKKEYVYKDLTVEEDKENDVNANNLSRYGHGDTDKLNTRGLMEAFKRETQNNKRVYEKCTDKSSAGNPLQHQMKKGVPSNQLESHYQTTNNSTYKRWQRSAFQTVTSRNEERPCWADPSVGGHFVRSLSHDKTIKNTGNLGITLSVTGNNVYQGTNRNKRQGNILGQGGSKKGAFKTEYQRTFDCEPLVPKVR